MYIITFYYSRYILLLLKLCSAAQSDSIKTLILSFLQYSAFREGFHICLISPSIITIRIMNKKSSFKIFSYGKLSFQIVGTQNPPASYSNVFHRLKPRSLGKSQTISLKPDQMRSDYGSNCRYPP